MITFMAQSIPSVLIPPGICHFSLEKLQMPHGASTKITLQQCKLQIPYLSEICNNLIRLEHEASTLRKLLLAASYNHCKKEHIDLINLNGKAIN